MASCGIDWTAGIGTSDGGTHLRRMRSWVLLAALLGGCASEAAVNTETPTTNPQSVPSPSSPFEATQVAGNGPPKVTITNTTDTQLEVDLAGPQTSHLSIRPGETSEAILSAGSYTMTLSDAAGVVGTATYTDTFANDFVYSWVVATKPIEPPQPIDRPPPP